MPLFVDGVSLEDFKAGEALYENALKNEGLVARTSALASAPVKEFPEGSPILYAGEKEVSTAVPSTSRFEWVGTDDGTTCVMVAIWQKGSPSYSGIAHIDSEESAASLEEKLITPLVSASKSDEGIEVIIAGGCWSPGFPETCNASFKMVSFVLECLNKAKVKLHLRTLLVLKDNPAKGLPLCMGLALNTRTGEARRAHCVTHGPLFPVRYLYLLSAPSKSSVFSIYDAQKDLYAIPPPSNFNLISANSAAGIMMTPDEKLFSFSTSPECETPRFAFDTKSAAAIVLARNINSYFPDGKTAYYDEKGNRVN